MIRFERHFNLRRHYKTIRRIRYDTKSREDSMRRPAALSPIALALGAIILAPGAGAREEGPTEIEKCQTISNPGSYKLVNNLVAPTTTDPFVPCLFITANFVTIDLAGFSIDAGGGTGILSTGAQVLHG